MAVGTEIVRLFDLRGVDCLPTRQHHGRQDQRQEEHAKFASPLPVTSGGAYARVAEAVSALPAPVRTRLKIDSFPKISDDGLLLCWHSSPAP